MCIPVQDGARGTTQTVQPSRLVPTLGCRVCDVAVNYGGCEATVGLAYSGEERIKGGIRQGIETERGISAAE